VDTIDPHLHRYFHKLGYFLVDQTKIFGSAKSAMYYCTLNNTRDLKFVLDGDIFGALDWTKEPQTDLYELYKQRAQQLRDKYDYVILRWSGGADSTNMVQAFLQNDIRPDEIQTCTMEAPGYAPKDGMHVEQRENFHLIKNDVERLGVKMTTVNTADFYEHGFDDPDWQFTASSPRTNSLSKFLHMYNMNHYKSIALKYTNPVVVDGLEKPQITNIDGEMVAYFIDNQQMITTFTQNYDINDTAFGIKKERFYVSGDLPELTLKQTHIVADYMQTRKDMKRRLELGYDTSGFPEETYSEMVIRLLYYKTWKNSFFTIGKEEKKQNVIGGKTIYGYRDYWIWTLPEHDIRKQKVKLGYKKYAELIDSSWFNNGDPGDDTVGVISDFYKLGKQWN
jgi:hypothetical protein